jgi:H+/gluconate symporter-like permease
VDADSPCDRRGRSSDQAADDGSFGEIMTEVGLLIGFGVLIGAFLHSAGAFHRLLDVFVRVLGATRLPYALSLLHSTIMPSIYVDVQVVLASPVARECRGRGGG